MALTNAREFVVSLDRFKDGADADRRAITRAAAMYALRGVVLGTRVATGRARGNWQVAEGAPPEGFEPSVFDPEGTGIEGGVARDALAEGERVINAASGVDIIWLHNGVPYIEVLEQWDGTVNATYEALLTWVRS